MQSHKQQTQPANNYLYRALVYGARPFLYRGRVRSLLGFPEWTGVDVLYPPVLPPVGFRYADYNYPLALMANTPTETSFANNIHDFAFTHEGYAGPAGVHPTFSDSPLVKQVETDVRLQGKMESPGTPKFTVTFCKPRRHEEHEENNIIKTPFNKKGSATPTACTAWSFYHVKDVFSNICFFCKLLQDISKKGSATPTACTAWPFSHVKDVFSNPCFFSKLFQGINKKFWEVQEPFFKRVPGRRRHRLVANPGTAEDSEISAPTVEQARMSLSGSKPGKPAEAHPSLSGQEDPRESITGGADVTEIRLPGISDRSSGFPSRYCTDDMYGTAKLQEPEIVKQVETDVQLQGKMESSGTAEDLEKSEPTMNQARMPLSDNKPGKRAELKKEKTRKQKPGEPREPQEPQESQEPQTPQTQKKEIVIEKVNETQLQHKMEKSPDQPSLSIESVQSVQSVPFVPYVLSVLSVNAAGPKKSQKPVSRLSPTASYWSSAARIEQLRQGVHRLNAVNTLKAGILSSSSGEKANRQREEEQPRVPAPPAAPVVIVKRPLRQPRTSRIPCAFWERSYLGRFHLRTLR